MSSSNLSLPIAFTTNYDTIEGGGKMSGRKRKYWVLLFTAVFILFTASGFIFGQSDFEKDEEGFIRKYKLANDQFKKCSKYLLKENYAKAEKGLRKCLEIMPQHVNSHFYLSQLLYRKGELEAALSHIEQAKTCYQSAARMIISIQKLNSHRIREQRKVLRELLDSYQGYEANDGACSITPILHEARDKMIDLDGKEPSARQLALLEQVPAGYFYIHGNILFKLKRYREAHAQYLEAIKANPKYGKAYNNLANLHYMNKEYRTALYYMSKAKKNGARINPGFEQVVAGALAKADTANFSGLENHAGQPSTGVERFQVMVGTPPDEFDQNTYVVYDKETRDALIIDPGASDPRIETFIRTFALKVKKILNTHGHHDHTGANRYYADLYHVKVAAHEADGIFYNEQNQKNRPDEFFSQEGIIQCGSLEVKILHTPGHSPGCVCYLVNGILFSGDTLFRENIGRTWGRTREEKIKKREQQIGCIKSKLFPLPGETPVFPGHGPSTTIGREKKNNSLL